MGTHYIGFDSKAALKPLHPQCLICDSMPVFATLPVVLTLWSVEQSEPDHWIMQMKLFLGKKKKLNIYWSVLCALLGSIDIIEETVVWRSQGGGGEGHCAHATAVLALEPTEPSPSLFSQRENYPVILWAVSDSRCAWLTFT